MIRLILFFLFLHYVAIATIKAQEINFSNVKSVTDSLAVANWISLDNELKVSNNGQYFMYSIYNKPNKGRTLILQSTVNNCKKEFVNAKSGFFSCDDEQFVYLIADTLFFLNLKSNEINFVTPVVSYKNSLNGKWVIYKLKAEELILHNLMTGDKKKYVSVTDYTIDEEGQIVFLIASNKKQNHINKRVYWIPLNGKERVIWESDTLEEDSKIINYSIDAIRRQVVFMVQKNGLKKSNLPDEFDNAIWYYNENMPKAEVKASNKSLNMDQRFLIRSSSPRFSKDGKYVFFEAIKPCNQNDVKDNVKVDVWNYKDIILQSLQLSNTRPNAYTFVMSTEKFSIIQITFEYEQIKGYSENGDFVIVRNDQAGDKFWYNEFSEHSVITNWIVSLKDGSRRIIKTKGYCKFYFSPGGKYLVYYDSKLVHNYFSYELITGETRNITRNIPLAWLSAQDEYEINPQYNVPKANIGVAGWDNKDERIFVYDNFDVWQLDLKGIKPAINLTNGYGRKNGIKLRLTYGGDEHVIYDDSKPQLLTAFQIGNKYNGFYETFLSRKGNPKLLTMGPLTYCHLGPNLLPMNTQEFDEGMKPLKARNIDKWIVKCQTAMDAPNYFLTNDFRKYIRLTNIQPHISFNWLTAELISWKQLDGLHTQGILYKPENFNPRKKYPVIINYYEQRSARLYQYPNLSFTGDNINIPWFVSRGFLVLTPDIYFRRGKPGQSVLNTVASAVKYLTKFPFVDAQKIGINGHSTGGFETNYLITHSKVFAAAIEGAGSSNWISSSFQLGYQGGSRLAGNERIIGGTLWQKQRLYLENSPILFVDKICTPLIIFHSKDDTAVPWAQAVELFIAMRRLNKAVWMLQYDGENHTNEGEAAFDFTIRITQFYEHYLKGYYAPKWMTEGIPAYKKGIDKGFELDSTKSCSSSCKVCKSLLAK